MWLKQKLLILLLIYINLASAIKYQFVPDDEDIFSDCRDQSSNVRNVHGVFDLTELDFKLDFDKISISGNATTVWDLEPSDRIQAEFKAYRFERGGWQPTVLSIRVNDYCRDLFDKRQYWYKFWTKHVINSNEAERNCLKVFGTKYIYEPFDADMKFDILGIPLSGRYKIIMRYTAFDRSNRRKKISICFQIIGEAVRLN